MSLEAHSLQEIDEIHATLTRTFLSGVTVPLAYRRRQLLQLARLAQDNADAIEASVKADLGRASIDTEVGTIISSCLYAAEHLEEWAKPEKPEVEEWKKSWDTTIYKVPKGTIVNISPWNFPWVLSFNALVGAIAAGCTWLLKPSEHTPNCARLMSELVPKYLDPNGYAVVLGAVVETTHILKLKWDHIFYTGSTNVGRIVAVAAAKQLTPSTLELGGKSPVIIDGDTTDLELAAKRIMKGKHANSGQVCVSPDHIYVTRKHQEASVAAFRKVYETFYPHPKGALDPASDLSHIVNKSHQNRLRNLFNATKGTVAIGGTFGDDLRIEPTIVKDATFQDSLMQEEIFGPIVPVIPIDSIDEALTLIKQSSIPLVIYLFTNNEQIKEKFIYESRSGQLVQNDTLSQLAVHEMPFGGQGDSGYGAYFGKDSFDTFTHRRGYIHVPLSDEHELQSRYPPYTETDYNIISSQVRSIRIPDA